MPPAEGGRITTESPLAASPDPRRATDNFRTAGLWAIRSAGARPVPGHRPAAEVQLPAGTALTVLVRSRFGDLPVTIVSDDPTADRRAVATTVATAVRRALAAPDLTDLEPGRYLTDLRSGSATWSDDELAADPARPLADGDRVALRFVDDADWQPGTIVGRQATGARDEVVVDVADRGVLLVTRADGGSWDTPPEPEVATRVTDGAGSPHRRAWLRVSPG